MSRPPDTLHDVVAEGAEQGPTPEPVRAVVGLGGAAVSVTSPPTGPRIVVPIGAIPAESLTSGRPACEWTAEDGRVMVSWRIGGTVNTIAADGGAPSRDVLREVIR